MADLAPALIAVGVLVWMILARVYEHWRRHPPGHLGLPLVGRLPLLVARSLLHRSKDFLELISEDAANVGDVWMTVVGTRRVVGLNAFRAVEQPLLMNPWIACFLPHEEPGRTSKYMGGVFVMQIGACKEQHRFVGAVFNSLEQEQSTMERKIIFESRALVDELCYLDGRAVAADGVLKRAVLNSICQFVLGFRIAYNDPEFSNYLRLLDYPVQDGSVMAHLFLLYPWLENKFTKKLLKKNLTGDSEDDVVRFLSHKISVIEAEVDLRRAPGSYVEAYLIEQQKRNDGFSRLHLVSNVLDLFTAGSEATAELMTRALAYLCVHRDWQCALQAEINAGRRAWVAYADRQRCHKTLAFIDEVCRHGLRQPHRGVRLVAQEAWYCGYRIPRGAFITFDTRSAHSSPELWRAPAKFDPTHFLTPGWEYRPRRHLVPFGVGKRSCVGERLAKMSVFVFLAAVLQEFSVSLDTAGGDGAAGQLARDGVITRDDLSNLKFVFRAMKTKKRVTAI